MLVLIVFLLPSLILANDYCPRETIFSRRIINGAKVNIKEHPYQVGIFKFGTYICSGTLVSSRYVLSAAHCVVSDDEPDKINAEQPQHYSIRPGSTLLNKGGIIVPCSQIKVHPLLEYTEAGANRFDFVLLKLQSKVIYNKSIQPIQLPSPKYQAADGTLCTIAGWGETDVARKCNNRPSTVLRAIDVPVVNVQQCNEIFQTIAKVEDDIMICTGYSNQSKSICFGDSGGGLITKDKVIIGVASWGKPGQCGDTPDVFARVSTVVGWIKDIIRNENKK